MCDVRNSDAVSTVIVTRGFNSMFSSSLSRADLPWNRRNTDSTSYECQVVSVHNERGLNLEVLNQSLRTYFKPFDTDKQIFLFNNIYFKCFKIMKGDYTKIKHMMDQIIQEVHIQLEKTQKCSNNKCNPKNNINLNNDEKCDKKLAKIHGHKYNKKYKKLLRSYDPILNDNELLKALSDPDDKIGRNYIIPFDLGTKMSDKANNLGINDKSEASSASTSPPPNVIKAPLKQVANSSEGTSLEIPNVMKSGKDNNISIIEILPDGNKQPAISADSSDINRNKSIQASSSNVEYVSMCLSPKVTIYQYWFENSTDFLKLKKIVFKHDPSSSETFKTLVYKLKKSFKFELPRVTNIIYNWHSPKMHVIQQLLQENLHTINQTKNKIIHFMTFLNLLFHKSVNTYYLSIDELYYSFFSFVDFIKRCLLSCINPILMEWLPMAWNNCFYYGLILVEYILYNDFKRMIEYKSIHTLLEWSYVPDIQKLFKILSYDNKSRSESIIYLSENINNYMKQRSRIKPKHQDIQDEPPKKKKKFTSGQQMFQQAQQSSELTVTMINTSREAQVILSSIASVNIEH
ncbi:uncharacterized protein LOC100574856 isoform X2 [Acyrthosiphon pisum]|uniref:Uncharacterized protein n=2 Tax=Acyrthosiphon pisum TaxID=7029 RepID=A0A8R2H6M8_ACYPI|nr:uncharacterized protein LOC100574856 isoform X2 [Acyrthosiphon pisum]|eukprot:XP_016662295.1 PREDICTED: uncharacterized protein LOC100574856 isoform X3 [Acyrthosiphon pisum]